MEQEITIGVPLPQFRQQVAGTIRGWHEANDMIPRDVVSLIAENRAVVAYVHGKPVGFMAQTNDGPSLQIQGGRTVELGALVKDPNAEVNGVGIVMTQALVDIEQTFQLSDQQIAMATTPQSVNTFDRYGGRRIAESNIDATFYGECHGCSGCVIQSGRRCGAVIFDLTPTESQTVI